MMKKTIFSLCVCGASVLWGSAQQVHQDSLRQLDEVVVSALRIHVPPAVSKIPAPKREIPITVNTISPMTIRDMNYQDIADVVRDVPGVTAIKDYGAFHMFFVRGFYQSLVLNNGIRDERQTLWQSAPITGLASVERIEILKGAASMTVGHSAIGGVINVVRKQPTMKRHFSSRVSVGSYGTYDIQMGASGRLADKLSFRADAELQHSDGWRSNYTRGGNAYLAIDYTPSAKQKLGLWLMGNKDRYKGDYGQPHLKWDVYHTQDDRLAYHRGDLPLGIDRKVSYSDPKDELRHSNFSSGIKYDLRLSPEWSLSEQLALYWDDILYYSTDGINYLEPKYYADHKLTPPSSYKYYYLGPNGAHNPVHLEEVWRDGFAFDYRTLSIQNQIELSGRVKCGTAVHNLLMGYNMAYLRTPRFDRATYTGAGVESRISVTNPILNQGDVDYRYGRRQLMHDGVHGLYAQDYLKWHSLAVLAGLRLDYFRRNLRLDNSDDKQPLEETYNRTTHNIALTYRLGLVYDLAESLNLYASASSFYKPERIIFSSDVVYLDKNGHEIAPEHLSNLKPQRGEQYEVGCHLDVSNQLTLSASAYYINLRNVISTNLGQTSDGKNIGGQIGRLCSKGVELEAAYSPCKEVGFTASYDLIDARLQSHSASEAVIGGRSVPLLGNVYSGNRLARVPRQQLSAWAFYTPRLTKHSALRLGLGLEHKGLAYTNNTNLYTMPAYTLLHALVSYRAGVWTLQINANNLLDKAYTRTAINAVQYLPGPGRNLSLSVSYDL